MKLIRLKINNAKGFRSLRRGFEIHFLNDDLIKSIDDFEPYLLVGRNGSGKSNVLEALAEIFYHLDCIYLDYKPDYFESSFNSKESRLNAYEIEFFAQLDRQYFPDSNSVLFAHVIITKTSKQSPKVILLNQQELGLMESDLSHTQIKSLLPEYVVGYASGNNEILSLPFFKSRFLQYDEYIKGLQTKEFIDTKPKSSLVYLGLADFLTSRT